MAKIEVLIVDDHRIVVEGLARVLELDGRVSIIGRAGSIAEAAVLLGQIDPDAVLLDLKLPDSEALEGLARLKALSPVPVVVLTGSGNALKKSAIEAGAALFLQKDLPSDAIIEAICSVADVPTRTAMPGLSLREADVARLVAQGLSNERIGLALCISVNTVKTHLKSAMIKLDVHDRTSLALKLRDLD